MPFTERAYYPLAAGGAGAGTGSVPFPAFQFRDRHEGPDWRRLSAVDVWRLSRDGDVTALQEHLEHVTFCSAERERCPHCQGPADPLLLKLLRLAQLCTEYLLHSQEYLSAQLGTLEEALRGALAQRDQLDKEITQRSQEIKVLKEECRRRKKMIITQQTMLEARASYHQDWIIGCPRNPYTPVTREDDKPTSIQPAPESSAPIRSKQQPTQCLYILNKLMSFVKSRLERVNIMLVERRQLL